MKIAQWLTTPGTWGGDAFCSIFPLTCLACECRLAYENAQALSERQLRVSLCADCYEQMGRWDRERCGYCAAEIPLRPGEHPRCRLCEGFQLHFASAFSIGNYQGLLKRLVLRMKAERNDILAMQLGRVLGFAWNMQARPTLDAIVPIPLGWRKRLLRGICLPSAIAEGFQEECRWPIRENVLKLIRSTKKQGTLSTPQRFENVRNAFAVVRRRWIVGRRLLLVDDVMTSGATLAEASRALLSAGAAAVWAAVVARGVRQA